MNARKTKAAASTDATVTSPALSVFAIVSQPDFEFLNPSSTHDLHRISGALVTLSLGV